MEPQKHLVDYVWMTPPGGGDPAKVSIDNIATNMWQGWKQVAAPPAEPKKKGE
jgi:hypothetical protein